MAALPTGTLILKTVPVSTSGYYMVHASINTVVTNGDTQCWATTGQLAPSNGFLAVSGAVTNDLGITDMLAVTAGDSIELWCGDEGTSVFSNVIGASVSAILMNQVNNTAY